MTRTCKLVDEGRKDTVLVMPAQRGRLLLGFADHVGLLRNYRIQAWGSRHAKQGRQQLCPAIHPCGTKRANSLDHEPGVIRAAILFAHILKLTGLICIKSMGLLLCESVVVRTVRIFLLLLLCWAIPGYGYASLGAVGRLCPMAASAAPQVASEHGLDAATQASAPCCDDTEPMTDTDHPPCKASQDCGGGGLALLVPGSALGLQAPQPVLHRFQADCLLEPDRSQVWRPPAAL